MTPGDPPPDSPDPLSTGPPPPTEVRCAVDEGFGRWIAGCGASLAFTTYQGGKLGLIGAHGGRVHFTMRDFPRPMGLAVDASGQRMALATAEDLILLADAPLLAEDYVPDGMTEAAGYDALYLPRLSYHCGNLNLHDLAFDEGGLLGVNTRFGCLARFDEVHSFRPVWQPPFLSQLAPEDRCHLNGVAIRQGQPIAATALGATDTPRGWVERRLDGGVLVNVPQGRTLARGLCLPHSPRWHDGRLWLLNSGRGELCALEPFDPEDPPDRPLNWEVCCTLPGYARGLCFVGGFAVVGLSRVRQRHLFAGLPVLDRPDPPECALVVVDPRSGQPVGRFGFTQGLEELYDVQALPGRCRPNVLNLQRQAPRRAFTTPSFAYWLTPRPRADPT